MFALQRVRTAGLLYLAFQTLGVVYGDIGTSPLYVFASIFDGPPSEKDVVGAVSLVLWSLTAIVTVKYALIVLRASDSGQGKLCSVYCDGSRCRLKIYLPRLSVHMHVRRHLCIQSELKRIAGGTFALYSMLKRAGDFRTFGNAHPADKNLHRYSSKQESQQDKNLERNSTRQDSDWRVKLARNSIYQQVQISCSDNRRIFTGRSSFYLQKCSTPMHCDVCQHMDALFSLKALSCSAYNI